MEEKTIVDSIPSRSRPTMTEENRIATDDATADFASRLAAEWADAVEDARESRMSDPMEGIY